MVRTVTAVAALVCLTVATAQESRQERKPAAVAANPKEAKGLAVGEAAPDAKLRDESGKEVSLAEIFAKGPVVLTFYRGGWCPYCTKQLRDWEGRTEELKAAGGTLVAVTLETPERVAEVKKKHEVGFLVLSDFAGEAMRRYRVGYALDEGMKKRYSGYGVDLSKSNANGQWEMPNAATFVVGKDGTIVYVFNDADYRERAKPDVVIAAVKRAAGK